MVRRYGGRTNFSIARFRVSGGARFRGSPVRLLPTLLITARVTLLRAQSWPLAFSLPVGPWPWASVAAGRLADSQNRAAGHRLQPQRFGAGRDRPVVCARVQPDLLDALPCQLVHDVHPDLWRHVDG